MLSYTVIFILGFLTKKIFRNRHTYTDLRKENKYPLLAFWHGRQFFGYFPHRDHSLVIPASFSEDGDIVAMTLGRMGHRIVRGSSSKGAVKLLVKMVKEVKKGAVNSIVILEISGGDEIVSVITNESVERLGLAQGKPAYAMIKASNVMIAVE